MSPFNSVDELQRHFEKSLGDKLKILFISEDNKEIHLHQLELNEKNKGYGSQILDALKNYANKVHKPITLSAQPNNRKKSALQRFYSKHDFKKPGRKRNYTLSAGHTHIYYPQQESVEHALSRSIDEAFRRVGLLN